MRGASLSASPHFLTLNDQSINQSILQVLSSKQSRTVPAPVEPTDTRLDHVVPSQAQTPTDDGGTASGADTPVFDELAGDSSDTMLDFESSMPTMLNLQAAGLRRSARIAAQ